MVNEISRWLRGFNTALGQDTHPQFNKTIYKNTLILDYFQLGEGSAPRWGAMLLWEVEL